MRSTRVGAMTYQKDNLATEYEEVMSGAEEQVPEVEEQEPGVENQEEHARPGDTTDEVEPEGKENAPQAEKQISTLQQVGLVLEQVMLKASMGLTALVLLYLTYHSLRYTYYFYDYEHEVLYTGADGVLKHLLILCLPAAGILLYRFVFVGWQTGKEEAKTWILRGLLAIEVFTTFILGVIWVKTAHIYPDGDQAFLMMAAEMFQNGDYTLLGRGGYLHYHPHQLGMVYVLEWMYRLFGNGKYYVFQYFNVLCTMATQILGYLLVKEMTQKHGAKIAYLVLQPLFLPVFLYIGFVYGDVPSIAFTFALLLCIMKFYETDYIRYGLLAILMSTLALLVRKNSLIVLIAVLIVLAVKSIKDKSLRGFLIILGLVMTASLLNPLLHRHYERVSGQELMTGIPNSAYIAMGMMDGYPGPGWYNNFNKEVFQQADLDTEMADEASKQVIRDRREVFRADKAYARDFYKRKFLSQWNEPTYGAFYLNSRFVPEHAETDFTYRLFYGDLHGKAVALLNELQILVYVLSLAGALKVVWREKRGELSLIPIAVFGGVLFSFLWEAKSRYVLGYVALLIPLASYALSFAGKEQATRYTKENH